MAGSSGGSCYSWGDRCAWEGSRVTTNNCCYSFSFWSRVSLHPTSEAPCLWWLVYFAYLVLWAVQRLLYSGNYGYKDRLTIVSNWCALLITTTTEDVVVWPRLFSGVNPITGLIVFKCFGWIFMKFLGELGCRTKNNVLDFGWSLLTISVGEFTGPRMCVRYHNAEVLKLASNKKLYLHVAHR